MRRLALLLLIASFAPPVVAQTVATYVPDLDQLVHAATSELAPVVERFATDHRALLRRHAIRNSPGRRAVQREFFDAWRARLAELDFDHLSEEGKIDYLLLDHELDYQLELVAREAATCQEAASLMPFASTIIALQEARRAMQPVDPEQAANTLAKLGQDIDTTRKMVEAGLKSEASDAIVVSKVVAMRGLEILSDLRATLDQWYRYYAGYDPLFSWWTEAPHKRASEALQSYVDLVRERLVGITKGQDPPIVGDPIGREALLQDLRHEWIDYSPEQLVQIAEREFAWCDNEMHKAARDMGCGDDWKAALERVKTMHVAPGQQPDLIRDQAREAIAFVAAHDLLTVPPLARDLWRIEMMSPERQKESPFFLGGEVILVSFPTEAMAHEDKLMSMRGNNQHFSRATVHHELIPGHHLQGFMNDRYATHRELFSTPFWTEGWALYFEMLFWDLGFPKTPENRVGMLFWRMHRCARIIFSLGFHLGTMTPQQCIDFLVDRVGHERANATAEVRRSFGGGYSPLYQVAYMMGGLQFRALHRELCEAGKMPDRAFHDAILQGGSMPVEMVRARLTNAPLTRDARASWKFAGELEASQKK